jgi:ABC-2 type transport system permease protein
MRSHHVGSVAIAVGWRATRNYLRNPAVLLPSLVFPLLFLAAFAGGTSRMSTVPGFGFPQGYTAFEFVYVLLQAVAYGGVFTGIAVALDFESGAARRLILAAGTRVGIVLGYVIFGIVRGAAPAALLTVVAILVGMRVGGGGLDLLGLAILALLVNVGAAMWAMGFAMRTRTADTGTVLQIALFMVLFLAPIYVPLKLMTGIVHSVATVNPATVFLETGRGFVSSHPTRAGLSFVIAGTVAGACLVWAYTGLRRGERAT